MRPVRKLRGFRFAIRAQRTVPMPTLGRTALSPIGTSTGGPKVGGPNGVSCQVARPSIEGRALVSVRSALRTLGTTGDPCRRAALTLDCVTPTPE